jgi:hypothetical protein
MDAAVFADPEAKAAGDAFPVAPREFELAVPPLDHDAQRRPAGC